MRVKAVKVLAALIRKTLGSQPTRFPEDVSVLTQQQEILLWIPAASVLSLPTHSQLGQPTCRLQMGPVQTWRTLRAI